MVSRHVVVSDHLRSVLVSSAILLAAASLAACGGSGSRSPEVEDPKPGDTRFISADGSGPAFGGPTRGGGAPSDDLEGGAGGAGGGDDGEGRTVEEGDIYRAFGESLLLNLNYYRGLQVIDLSDLAQPRVLSRLEISGVPVELYVTGDRAVVLLDEWIGYYGGRGSSAVARAAGGLVLLVDLSNPEDPAVIGSEVVPGSIRTSRLTRAGDRVALYVVSSDWASVGEDGSSSGVATSGGSYGGGAVTAVRSFDLSGSGIVARSRLDLGGWVADIQATPEALLVARTDWTAGGTSSRVSMVDISSPDGVMVEGDEVPLAGVVSSQFNMDLYKGVLRVVSGSTWGGTTHNHLETFDASDPSNLVPVDAKTFGSGESLFGTLFLGNSAFFVTYLRQDPFHAFEITDAGIATEKSQFIVSGWNDWFRAVFSGTRLVGVGVDDAGPRKLAVSLYDVTDLENANPLVGRAQVEIDWSWSEASWDHRAFSVIEGAVSIPAADGATETGLVLLPYSGWDASNGRSIAGVQIFTFSPQGITARGTMDHGSPVRRSFAVGEETAGNLSNESLSLFSTADPEAPVELGRVDLAPRYDDLLFFDGFAVRQHVPGDPWSYYRDESLPDRIEIVPAGGSADGGAPVAAFDVPAGSTLRKVGSRLVAVSSKPVDWNWPYRYETTISSFDLADPTHPVPLGELVSEDLPVGQSWDWWMYDCFDCGRMYSNATGNVHVASDDTLVLVAQVPRDRLLGTARVCAEYPISSGSCWGTTGRCFEDSGARYCSTLNGETNCEGSFYRCEFQSGERQECLPLDPAGVATSRYCHDEESRRYWTSFEAAAVEIPASGPPRLGDTAQLPIDDEAVAVVPAADGVWLSTKVPYRVPGDARSYALHHVRKLEASAGTLAPTAAINVPGPLLEVDDDTIYTRHFMWSQNTIDSAVAKLERDGDVARLVSYRRFAGAMVSQIRTDGAGHVLLTYRDGATRGPQRLSVLDSDSPSFATLADVEVSDWADLRDAVAGRAVFDVPGGLLVFNLDQPAAPWPQAYFALRGWPQGLRIEGRRLYVPAGPFGIYELDLDGGNLPAP